MNGLVLGVLLAAHLPVFSDCRLGEGAPGPRLAAECTTLDVPENPAEPGKQRISLKIARLKARTGDGDKAPLVFIAGGPGQSALETFPAVAAAFEDVRRTHDVLLIDQRGTGGSNPLRCPELGADDMTTAFDAAAARRAAEDCLQKLDADVRFYTTIDAVRDLEAVRDALGYPSLALYGISYGTRVAQEYLRRHPDRVDTVILDGVTDPGEVLGPEIAADAQRALDMMFDRCAASKDCSKSFPDLRVRFDRLRSRLEARPLDVTVRHPYTGERTDVSLSWPRIAMLLRLYSYSPGTVALLPLLLTHAEAGDWQGAAGNVLAMERQTETLLYIGMHNSVICSEDAPLFGIAATDEPAYLGTLTVDAIRAMCTVWPTREIPADFREPVTGSTPVLLLSGEADPVTPPANAAAVAGHLDNARHIVAPGQGHGVAWVGCAPTLIATFLDDKDPDALDASCLEEMEAAPFFIDRNGPTP